MNLDFMKKMQSKLNAVTEASIDTNNKSDNNTIVSIDSNHTTTTNITPTNNKGGIVIESKTVPSSSIPRQPSSPRKRRGSVADISIKVGDDPEVVAEQYITELGITDERKRIQIFKRVTRHLCNIQYREILTHNLQKKEIQEHFRNEIEKIKLNNVNDKKEIEETFIKEKMETVEKYEKKVNDVLSYSTNIEDILSKSRIEKKALEKKYKLATSQLILVKPIFKVLESEDITEENVTQHNIERRDMTTRFNDLVEKTKNLEKKIKENQLMYDRDMHQSKMQTENFVDDFRKSYEMQLSKYKEEVNRMAKNEIEIRKNASLRINELTKNFQTEKKSTIEEMKSKHTEIVVKLKKEHQELQKQIE